MAKNQDLVRTQLTRQTGCYIEQNKLSEDEYKILELGFFQSMD